MDAVKAEDGISLIEVVVSALLVALIVVGTLTGFDASNRTSADERARSQADSFAQQDEDRLRGLQVTQLNGLKETRTITSNGTVFTVKSSGVFISDGSGSESCTAGSTSADYIRTKSEVTWPALKSRPAVSEVGLVAPRLGGTLLTQVHDASGVGIPGFLVVTQGPAPSTGLETGTTDAGGCVIASGVEPGEYQVKATKAGYVEKNGLAEVPTSEQAASVINGATSKKEFEFGLAGAIQASFTGSTEGDAFVAFNTSMTTFRTFGTVGTFGTLVTSPTTVFPFTSTYTVYAGNCESDNPHTINSAITDSTVTVTGGATVKPSPALTVPPVAIKVYSGKSSASPGKLIEGAEVRIEDTGCTAVRTQKTNSLGALPRPNLPYGKYKLCVTGGTAGGKNGATTGLGKERKYTTTFSNNTATGPSLLSTMTNGGLKESAATIYLENGAPTTPGTLGSGSTCP